MKSIGVKISVFVYLIAASAFISASFAHRSYLQYDQLQTNLQLSLQLRGYAAEIQHKEPTPEITSHFKKMRQSVKEKPRFEALSNLVQAMNAKNKSLMELRFKELQIVEAKYYKDNEPQLSAIARELRHFMLLSVLSPIFGILLFSTYLKRSIVKPLQKLSQRMMDFLVDRYTFKLSTPTDNEIGDLQRTFNSLAQNVLNNMDELKALDRAKSEFVSIASHELRTPLTSIKGSLGILSSGIVGELDQEALGLIRIAESETDRLVRLINNLLDLAKMEAHTFSLKKEWVPVLSLAESCLEALLGLANTAQVRLEIRHPEEEIECSLDKDRIHQVITNLMSNAIKYSPKNAAVVLSYRTLEEGLEIAVTDRGPGIPAHDQELIFEKFRQGTQAESKLVKGTGLGLAISKALVEEHGGYLSLRSEVGQGSTFFFIIPEWRIAPQAHNTVRSAA